MRYANACCFEHMVVLSPSASSSSFLDFFEIIVVDFCLVFGAVDVGGCDIFIVIIGIEVVLMDYDAILSLSLPYFAPSMVSLPWEELRWWRYEIKERPLYQVNEVVR